MAYPTNITTHTTKIDKNASGWYVPNEYFNVPSAAPYEMYLDHVPMESASTTVGASGGAAWTEVTGTPAANQYQVSYTTGKVTFNSANASDAVGASYYSLGDDIMAEHMNTVQIEILNTQNALGTNVAGAYVDLSARLAAIQGGSVTLASGVNGDLVVDDTIRAGALMDDIKGIAWITEGRPTLASNRTDINAHVADSSGAHHATAISAAAPGGATYDMSSVQDHIRFVGAGTITSTNPHGVGLNDIGYIANLGVMTITASGGAMYIDNQSVESNAFLYFYENGAAQGRQMGWDDTNDKFTMNDALETAGLLESAGVTASGNVMPYASGVYDVGSIDFSWASGNFDSVQAVEYKTGSSTGANGSFIAADGQTVKVENGIIVSII